MIIILARFAKIYYLFLWIILLPSCAQIVGPSGGAKDLIPPKVIKEIPENKKSNFSSKKITIYFNEFIQLKEIDNQLIISPPLLTKPAIVVNGKTMVIELYDKLDTNTTYTFHFGNSITDNHESNILSDYQYVLSTGNTIDSLTIKGKIQDAFNSKTEAGFSVCLYDAAGFTDSIIFKQKPVYYSKTNSSGNFSLFNLPNKSFYLIAFKDENKNLKYDKNEVIAYTNKIIQPVDSIPLKTLLSYKPNPYLINMLIDTIGKEKGRFYFVVFKPTKTSVTPVSKSPYYTWFKRGKNNIDTFILFNKIWDSSAVFFKYTTPQGDTSFAIKSKKGSRRVPFEVTIKKELDLSDSIVIHFSQPYEKIIIDTSKLLLKEDSFIIKPKIIQYPSKDVIKLFYPLKEKAHYSLILQDSAIQDIYGNYNKKTTATYQTKSLKDYSSLLLNIIHPKDSFQYIVQLVTEDESNIYKEFYITKSSTLQLDYLLPGKYKIKIIRDINRNFTWDNGDYFTKQYPESVNYHPETIVLRAYWDLEQTINLTNIVD